MNRGYIGSSRSVRSQKAIKNFEVPLTHINRNLIEFFLEKHKDNYTEEDFVFLKKTTVTRWKYIGSEIVCPASWHHTSSYFNETDHYKLADIASELIKRKETIEIEYKEFLRNRREKKEKEKNNFTYGVIRVQIWEETKKRRSRFNLIGYRNIFGIIIGDWLYYKKGPKLSKCKINARKVEWVKKYENYSDLKRKFPKYKKTDFDWIIQRKIEKPT